MSTTADYYELLGVGRDAAPDQIKRAYRRLAKEYHPDVNPDPTAEARFKEISKAYETLSDTERRARYDRFGPEENAAGNGFGPGFGGGIDDLLGMFMDGFGFSGARGGRGRPGPPRGGDVETSVQLDFEQAVFGTETDVTVRTPVACGDCSGSGASEGTQASVCPDCGGAGQVRRVRQSILGQMVSTAPCMRCGGLGEVISNPCSRCHGDGRVTEERTYTVGIPAGVDAGTTLRLGGRGAAGPRGGAPGDLFVHIDVRQHAYLQRRGAELHHRMAVPFSQATLGVTMPYATLDGEEQLTISRGTQSGYLIRLRGKGVPVVQGRGRGDLVVEVVVDTPTDLTQEQEELVRRLAELRGEVVAEEDKGFFAKFRSRR